MTNSSPHAKAKARRQRLLGAGVAAMAGAMLGLSYAAVPLYRMFCAATGFGGTPQIAEHAPSIHGTRRLTVSFDTNVAPGLDWSFTPETQRLSVLTGETQTVFFKVVNRTDREIAARASYNVSPDISGAYFDKINCFCFSEQTLAPRETAEMPVVFFLDPALEKDKDMTDIAEITLSYTFFPVKSATPAVATKNELFKDKDKSQL
jgi:cytochrome c oxidase assembly protein subunit 11